MFFFSPGVRLFSQAPADATVAVLVEPAMRPQGGTPSVSPTQIPALLEKCGLKARAFSAEELAREGMLNARDFPVLVLPYGNAFPSQMQDAIRAYHRGGGCLVVNGLPFRQPLRREGKEWKEESDAGKFFMHDDQGAGVGTFSRPEEGTLRIAHYGFQANPLGLDDAETPLPQTTGKPLCLNPASLDRGDEVIPVVELLQGHKTFMVSALIRHKCPLFSGAADVWIGQVADRIEEADAYFARQMLVRGTAWCLREKGLLSETAMKAVFDRAAGLGRPAALPSGLAYRPQPRPWGDTFLPRSHPPARRLLLVDTSKCTEAERRALICLQALTSREQPRLWLMRNPRGNDLFWLDCHVQKGYLDGYDKVADWSALFRQFAGSFKGAVIPDPALYRGDVLAANVAACEDLIIATPELAARLGLPVKIDLRGRFSTYADGLEWVWETYKDRLNRHLCDITSGMNGANAYAIQWRAVMFWPSGPVDGQRPGADMMREKRVVARIMSEMAPNTAMLGFPYAGEGVGLGETSGVKLSSGYALSLICSDSIGNVSVTSGVPVSELRQKPFPPAPALERDKIYIALAMSDGDNQQTWLGFFKKYFDHPRYGDFPLAFGIGPPVLDMQPAVAQWYYEHAAPNTEFLADVSGIGYIQPENYGKNYTDPAAVFDGFLDWTNKYQARLDLKTLRPVNGDDELFRRYAARVSGMHSLLADMGRYTGLEGINRLVYSLPDGLPVLHAATSWRYGKEGFLREVREQVGDVRPAFVNGFVHCWTFGMDDIARIYDGRDKDMVFVTPSQLAALYREARQRGWVK